MADAVVLTAVGVPARGGIWGERRSLTLGLLLVVTLVAFEALAVATVLPLAREDLGGLRLYGWAFSAFLLASLVGIVWAGEQSDVHGPAGPFVLGLALFAAGLVVAGLAPAMWVLVAGRAIQGLGAGVVPAVAYVAVGRAYEDGVRPRILALFSTAWVVPGLVGPGVAAAVAETLSGGWSFSGCFPWCLWRRRWLYPGCGHWRAPVCGRVRSGEWPGLWLSRLARACCSGVRRARLPGPASRSQRPGRRLRCGPRSGSCPWGRCARAVACPR